MNSNRRICAALLALTDFWIAHGFLSASVPATRYPVPPVVANAGTSADAAHVPAKQPGASLMLEEGSFISKVAQAFMEDVDAYGVMWHVNYLKFYDRALHTAAIEAQERTTTGASTILAFDDWSVVCVHSQKFRKAVRLGDSVVVSGQRVGPTSLDCERWSMTMTDSNDQTTVYNTIEISIARQSNGDHKGFLPDRKAYDLPVARSFSFQCFRDEFDRHLPWNLPLTTVMNCMERSRTTYLGGPDALRKMKEENGLVFFIVSAEDTCLVGADAVCVPGDKLVCEISLVPKRRGMIMDIYHTIFLVKDSGDRHRIAQGLLTLMTFSEATGKPASLPEDCQERIGLF